MRLYLPSKSVIVLTEVSTHPSSLLHPPKVLGRTKSWARFSQTEIKSTFLKEELRRHLKINVLFPWSQDCQGEDDVIFHDT